MSEIYKEFDLNDLATPKPWAPRELVSWKDVIDTLVMDSIVQTKQTGGHKHDKLYSPSAVAGVQVLGGGVVQIAVLDSAGIVLNDASGNLSTIDKLPVAKGGTNSDAALSNDRVMVSVGGAIVESAITADELDLLNDMTGLATGTSNNDKFATQGYVDDNVFPAIVPIDRGGTNSDTALNDDRVMISSGGAIVESDQVTVAELSLLNGMASVSTGTSDNDKLVTQGYVDDVGFGIVPIVRGGTNSDTALSDDFVIISESGKIIEGAVTVTELGLLSGKTSTDIDNWDAAYTHSGLATGNPHSVTFLQLGDTQSGFTINRILFESGSAVVDSADFTWDDSGKVLYVNGNVSIGKTLESWLATKTVLQIGGQFAIIDATAEAAGQSSSLLHNTYLSTDQFDFRRITNDEAEILLMGGGKFRWYLDNAGTEDVGFTPTQRMVLTSNDLDDTSSNLVVGGRSDPITSDINTSSIEVGGSEYGILLSQGSIWADLLLYDMNAADTKEILRLRLEGDFAKFQVADDTDLSTTINNLLSFDMNTGNVGIGVADDVYYKLTIQDLGTAPTMAMESYSTNYLHRPQIHFRKSHQDTMGRTDTIDGEYLGAFNFYGVADSSWELGFTMTVIQDGTDADNLPTKVKLSIADETGLHDFMAWTKDGNIGQGTFTPFLDIATGSGDLAAVKGIHIVGETADTDGVCMVLEDKRAGGTNGAHIYMATDQGATAIRCFGANEILMGACDTDLTYLYGGVAHVVFNFASTVTNDMEILTLRNKAVAASMTDTRTSLVFEQFYYEGFGFYSPVSSGKITVGTEGNWTDTASTQDSYMAFLTSQDGVMGEAVRINSVRNIGQGTATPLLNVGTAAGDFTGHGVHIKSTIASDEAAFLILEGAYNTDGVASAIIFSDSDGSADAKLFGIHMSSPYPNGTSDQQVDFSILDDDADFAQAWRLLTLSRGAVTVNAGKVDINFTWNSDVITSAFNLDAGAHTGDGGLFVNMDTLYPGESSMRDPSDMTVYVDNSTGELYSVIPS